MVLRIFTSTIPPTCYYLSFIPKLLLFTNVIKVYYGSTLAVKHIQIDSQHEKENVSTSFTIFALSLLLFQIIIFYLQNLEMPSQKNL